MRCKKSLFLSFVNEGDPVPRADKAYVRSLLRLYASPAPGEGLEKALPAPPPPPLGNQRCALGWGRGKRPKEAKRANSAPAAMVVKEAKCVWKVPPGTLSNAGKLVVLRSGDVEGDVKAEITCDEEMRGVVFGDPVMRRCFLFETFCRWMRDAD